MFSISANASTNAFKGAYKLDIERMAIRALKEHYTHRHMHTINQLGTLYDVRIIEISTITAQKHHPSTQ